MLYTVHILYNSSLKYPFKNLYPALSLRGRGLGFPLATMNTAPGYFQRKEEKESQKKPLAIWFPAYFFGIYLATQNLSDNPAYLKPWSFCSAINN